MNTIFDELPPEMGETTDWNVKLGDGTLLPCHSQCLGAISPVLAFALKTADKEASIPFPERLKHDTAIAFFRWVYRLKFAFTPNLAFQLARLSHQWDVKGLAKTCDTWLTRHSANILDKERLRHKGASSSSKTPKKRQRLDENEGRQRMADWLSLSDECQLPRFKSRCIHAAINDWEFHKKDFEPLELKGSLWSLLIDRAISDGKEKYIHWKEYAMSIHQASGEDYDSADHQLDQMSPEPSDEDMDFESDNEWDDD